MSTGAEIAKGPNQFLLHVDGCFFAPAAGVGMCVASQAVGAAEPWWVWGFVGSGYVHGHRDSQGAKSIFG